MRAVEGKPKKRIPIRLLSHHGGHKSPEHAQVRVCVLRLSHTEEFTQHRHFEKEHVDAKAAPH